MPLIKSGSKTAVGKNIKREMAAGKPRKQAIAIALSTQRKYQHSPDRYTPDAVSSVEPPRLEYHSTPTNVTRAETAKRAGGTPGGVQQAEGTENRRTEPKTKSSTRPEAGSGKTRWDNVDSYDDTKDF